MILGTGAALLWACGPDNKPPPTCMGPSIVLVVEAENGRLPEDLRLTVRYGGNPDDGEEYLLGEDGPHQAVICKQDPESGGAGAAGDGAGGASAGGVKTLRCSLYTQGPARLDASATGYESIMDEELKLGKDERCEHEIKVTLRREMDAG